MTSLFGFVQLSRITAELYAPDMLRSRIIRPRHVAQQNYTPQTCCAAELYAPDMLRSRILNETIFLVHAHIRVLNKVI